MTFIDVFELERTNEIIDCKTVYRVGGMGKRFAEFMLWASNTSYTELREEFPSRFFYFSEYDDEQEFHYRFSVYMEMFLKVGR